jgi:hypothetical protein
MSSKQQRAGKSKGSGGARNGAWAALSWDDLTEWAGSRSVERGRVYQRQGRVHDLAISEEPSFIAQSLPGTLSSRFYDMVDNRVLPIKVLTQQEEDDLNNKLAWLSANRQNYYDYQVKYLQAQAQYNQEAQVNPGSDQLPLLQSAENEAYDAWDQDGQKSLYETTQGIVDNYNAGNGISVTFAQMQRDEQNYLINAGGKQFYPTYMFPPVKTWAEAGWNSASFEVDDSSSSSWSSSTSWSAGLSASWGFWGGGGDISEQTNQGRSETSASSIKVSFEYTQAFLNRPWYDDYEQVVTSQEWGWEPTTHAPEAFSIGGDLSLTSPRAPDVSKSTMPIIIKSVIVVRNVQITGIFSSSDYSYFNQQMQTQAHFGWGPFSCGGSYSSSTSTQSQNSQLANGQLLIPDPTIVAFYCAVLPDCPKPDLSLNWPVGHVPVVPSLDTASFLKVNLIRLQHQLEYQNKLASIRKDFATSVRNVRRVYDRKLDSALLESQLPNGSKHVERADQPDYETSLRGLETNALSK